MSGALPGVTAPLPALPGWTPAAFPPGTFGVMPGAPLPSRAAARHPAVVANILPYDSLARVVIVDGGLNFLALYQGLITLRILLSWFPQSQSIGALQPVFTVSDVYLNLFRGVIPPLGGLDLSPILAFFLLNFAQGALASL